MIYTGYFAQLKHYKNPISIAGKPPAFYTGPEYKKLAPHYKWWKQWHDEHLSEDFYIERYYRTILNKLDAEKVYEELKSFYPGQEDLTILCFEKPQDFCHRHLAAKFFIDAGIPCEEFYGY
jgi:hypothetical protein